MTLNPDRLDEQARRTGAPVPQAPTPEPVHPRFGSPHEYSIRAPAPLPASTMVADRAEQQVADPIRDSALTRLQVLGLAYAPAMSPVMAQAVAKRLYDWSAGDPDMLALIDEDFAEAVGMSRSQWWGRGDSLMAQAWNQAYDVVQSMAGRLETDDRHMALVRRNRLAQVAGPDAIAARIGEMPSQDREAFILEDYDPRPFHTSVAGADPMGAAFGALLKLRGEELAVSDSQTRRRLEHRALTESTPHLAMAYLAQDLVRTGQVKSLSAGTDLAVQLFEQLSPEEKAELTGDVSKIRSEELVAEFEASIADRDLLKETAKVGLDAAMEVMLTWDTVAHGAAIQIMEEVDRMRLALGDPTAGLASAPETPLEALQDGGWQAFQTSFDALKEGGIAGYYGMDPASSAAGWVNLGASIMFDPLNFITLGTGAQAKVAAKWMSSGEAGADAFLASGRGRRFVTQIATTDDTLQLAPMLHGMSGEARLTLLNATDEAVVADVIRNEVVNGDWLMNGPALALRHQSYLGAGEIGRRLANTNESGVVGKVGEWVNEMLRRQDGATRRVALGETEFLDDATELIVARFPNDPDKARDALREVYELFADYEAGGRELAAQRVAKVEELRRARAQVRKAASVPVRRVGVMREKLAVAKVEKIDLERRVNEAQEALARHVDEMASGQGAPSESIETIQQRIVELDEAIRLNDEQIAALTEHTERFGAAYDEMAAQRATLGKQASEVARMNEEAVRPKSRAALAQWYDDFMGGWADDLELPRKPNGDVDWSEVRAPGTRIGKDADEGRLGPFGEMAPALEAIGAFESGSHKWLPVSPMELALYRGAKEAGAVNALRNATPNWVGASLHRINRTVNTIWAANLLFNPLNAAKAHIEDVFKFGVAGGPGQKVLKAMVGKADDARSAAFVRQTVAGLERRRAPWATIERGKRGHFEAARRFLEGSVIQDEAMRVYAQAARSGDKTVWFEWWDTIGQYRTRGVAVPIPGAKPIIVSAASAYEVMERSVQILASGSDDAAEFTRMLLEAAAGGKREVPARLAKIAGTVPVEGSTMAPGLGAMFDVLYGAPARRRGGVFFEHYYDEATRMLEKRWEGRIIDDRLDDLVEAGFAQSRVEAEALIAMRDLRVDEYLRRTGLTTRGRLEQKAADWATRHAESLMYLSGAASMGTRQFAKVAPFAPAQFDFLRWWTKQFSAGTDFVLNTGSRALANAEPAIAHMSGLNLRVAGKWAHLAAESDRRSDDTGALHPISLIERFTFLPVALDDPDNFLSNFLPGLGPIPTWLIHLVGDLGGEAGADIEDAATSLIPSLGWVTADATTLEGMTKHLLPATTRSVTGVAGWVSRAIGSQKFMDDNIAQALLDLERRPIGSTDVLKYNLGMALAENPNLTPGVDDEQIGAVVSKSLLEANRAEATSRFKTYFGIGGRFQSDDQSLEFYEGMVQYVRSLADQGIVGSPQAERLLELWPKVQDGTASRAELRLFGNGAASMLFDLPDTVRDRIIAEHPELAVNMVSTIRCATDSAGNTLAPAGYCKPDGRVDTSNPELQGSQGADRRREGFEKGWFEPRPEHEVAVDVIFTFNQARGRYARNLFEQVSGIPYRDRLKKADENATFRLSDEAIARAEQIGVRLAPAMSGAELKAAFRDAIASWPQEEIGPENNPLFKRLMQQPEYGVVLDRINKIKDRMQDADIRSMYDWPDEVKALAREQFEGIAMTDPTVLTGYNTYLRGALGPLDYQAPTPPAESDLFNRVQLAPSDVSVVDGDTIMLHTASGDLRVRVIGLNAPERGQDGYLEAWDSMSKVLEGASRITIGQFMPEVFGATQEVDVGVKRLFAWLYIDGVPLYDPSVFTATNQSGARSGGETVDLVGLLDQARSR